MSVPFLDLGDGVEVRKLEPDDADEIYAIVEAERERLKARMPWAEGATLETTREFIESNVASTGLDALGIFVDGAFVGGIGIRPDELEGDCEIGYWIASAYEGRGLVTAACRALVAHAFGELGLHRVTIRVAPDNARSRAIPERLGFTHEGVMREAGRTSLGHNDLIVYGLLDREWKAE